eukprot:TRINITY_DN16581_c0_g1_i1.p1 TRINITY_DN16581_c0_g1~~TRINITY_DN16581_c0_g1_i1.p1  ORF type:complete len:115 (+),score=1.92 TRINITY_DN16581_c0_g1_i1:425-769(+)
MVEGWFYSLVLVIWESVFLFIYLFTSFLLVLALFNPIFIFSRKKKSKFINNKGNTNKSENSKLKELFVLFLDKFPSFLNVIGPRVWLDPTLLIPCDSASQLEWRVLEVLPKSDL